MLLVIIILLFITAVSLYEFRDSKDARKITEIASKSLDSKHGAHNLQRFQSYVLAVILGVLFVVIALTSTIYDNMSFVSSVLDRTDPNRVDTLDKVFNLPAPDDAKKQVEIQQMVFQGDGGYSDRTQIAQEEAHKSDGISHQNEREENPRKDKSESTEQQVYDFEKQLFEETGGTQKRANIERQREETRKKKEQFDRQQQEQRVRAGVQNPTIAKGGRTMVSYHLPGRKPHNNDIYYVRNPGYTCEQGSKGEVVINIEVNSSGNVISTEPKSSYSNLNPCLVEQALKYARLSRFDNSSQGSQRGTITYVFVP